MLDPLIDLISEYDTQIDLYKSLVPSEDHDNQFARSTFLPIYDRLVTQPPLPTTPAGVVRGLECAHREMVMALDNELAISVVGVCIAYLKGHFG